MDFIEIKCAKENNLKGIDVRIPLSSITVITGPSGSGKSTLAADVIYPEGYFRYLEALDIFQHLPVKKIRRPDVAEIIPMPPTALIQQLPPVPSSLSSVATIMGLKRLYRRLLGLAGNCVCPGCRQPVHLLKPADLLQILLSRYSGQKLIIAAGVRVEHGMERALVDELLQKGFVRVISGGDNFYLDEMEGGEGLEEYIEDGRLLWVVVDRLLLRPEADVRLQEAIVMAQEIGQGLVRTDFSDRKSGKGGSRIYSLAGNCPACGQRFDPVTADRVLGGRDLKDFLSQKADAACSLLLKLMESELAGTGGAAAYVARAIMGRLNSISEIGLGYLPLDRPLTEVSAGELHKLHLLQGIRQGLSGVLYILDEPLGRYLPKEQEDIWQRVLSLKKQGNTVVLVEHDPAFISRSDWVIELGPGAGSHGGEVIFQGSSQEWRSRMGAKIQDPLDLSNPAQGTISLSSTALSAISMKKLPASGLVVFSGPTGSGKTTLLKRLYSEIKGSVGRGNGRYKKRIFWIPRVLASRSTSSMVVSALGVWADIRRLYSRLPDARTRGLNPSFFSLTRKGGRCEECRGLGVVSEAVEGLPLFENICPVCNGNRFSPDLQNICFKGYSMPDLMKLSLEQAVRLFSNIERINAPMKAAVRFGLGYLPLGQPISRLSGGERQRLRLTALGLKKRAGIFFIDEPSSGLSNSDLHRLIKLFQWIADQEGLVVAASNVHALRVAADLVVDLYPNRSES